MEVLTVFSAMRLARSIVTPTAMATTIKISSAVRPNSFQTSGKRAFSSAGRFSFGSVVEPATVKSIVLQARCLVRFADFIEVLRQAIVAAVDHQGQVASHRSG